MNIATTPRPHPIGRSAPLYDAVSSGSARSTMPLTLRDLLDDSGLGLALVAGATDEALDTVVRWAHISDTPDPTPWLEGGEVLLTTGLGVRDDAGAQRRLVTNLRDRGCVAIGFGVGVTMADVPAAMRDTATEVGMPLFTVPFEVPFIAVTRRVARAVFEDHYATLRAAVDLHRKVLGAVAAGDGIPAVLRAAGERLPQPTLLVYDFGGRVVASYDPAGRLRDGLDADELWPSLIERHHDRDRVSATTDGHLVTSAAVKSGAEIQALLAVVSDGELEEHHALLVEQLVAGISMDLARGQSVRETSRVRVDELLEEVAEGRAAASMVERVLGRLDVDPQREVRVLWFRRPRGVSDGALCTVIEDVLVARGHTALVGRHAGDVVALTPAEDEGLATAIVTAIRERGWPPLVIGRSTAVDPVTRISAGLREARTAATSPAASAGQVFDVDAIGVEGMLATIREGAGARTFVSQVLGPVLAYDAAESTELVPTLRAYLRHGCRPGPAANELSVHRHTLTYRLERVHELTGRDPRDGTHLLEFTLALALADEVRA